MGLKGAPRFRIAEEVKILRLKIPDLKLNQVQQLKLPADKYADFNEHTLRFSILSGENFATNIYGPWGGMGVPKLKLKGGGDEVPLSLRIHLGTGPSFTPESMIRSGVRYFFSPPMGGSGGSGGSGGGGNGKDLRIAKILAEAPEGFASQSQLPKAKQLEYQQSIATVVKLIKKAMAEKPKLEEGAIDLNAGEVSIDLEGISAQVHSKGSDGKAPDKTYDQLSHHEKQKHRDLVTSVMDYLNGKLEKEGIKIFTSDYIEALCRQVLGDNFLQKDFLIAQRKLREAGVWQRIREIRNKVFVENRGKGLFSLDYLREMLSTGDLSHLPEKIKDSIRWEMTQLENEVYDFFMDYPIEAAKSDWILDDGPYYDGASMHIVRLQRKLLAFVEVGLLLKSNLTYDETAPALYANFDADAASYDFETPLIKLPNLPKEIGDSLFIAKESSLKKLKLTKGTSVYTHPLIGEDAISIKKTSDGYEVIALYPPHGYDVKVQRRGDGSGLDINFDENANYFYDREYGEVTVKGPLKLQDGDVIFLGDVKIQIKGSDLTEN